MEQTEGPLEPNAMSPRKAVAYAIGLPLSLIGLIFLPAGTIAWPPGWIFLAVLVLVSAHLPSYSPGSIL